MGVTDALGAADHVELGYWLSSEEHSPAALLEQAAAAEAAGFRVAVISDHFQPWVPQQGNSAFVWSVLGGIACSTRTLRVGTVSSPMHRTGPLVIAHAAATVETLMPGRFFLGLGTGERLNEQVTAEKWLPPRRRRARLREAVGVIRALLDGRTVNHDGEHFHVERARLFTVPDTPPPIAVAANGAATARIAAETADAVIGVRPSADLVDAFEAAGGAGRPRVGQVHVCWAATEGEARRTAHRWWPQVAIAPALLSELARPADFAAAASSVSEDDVAAAVACGPDPDRHLEAVARFVAAGYTTVCVHQVGPDQHGFLEFCRRELLPRFARA